MSSNQLTVGLFGTCDGIRWRDEFMAAFDQQGIQYFNPMVDDWTPDLVAEENRHLLEDKLILFPVLKESLGTGSLGEIGFSILNAIQSPVLRKIIVFIDPECQPIKPYDAASIKQSKNARVLVRSKVLGCQSDNVILVDSLEEMKACCFEQIDMMKKQLSLTRRLFKTS